VLNLPGRTFTKAKLKMNLFSKRKPAAFTLIELTVVILIIATLAAFILTGASGVLDRAKKIQAKNDLTQIVTAVNAFYTEYGHYPVTVTSSTTDAFFGTGTTLAGCTSYGNNDALIDVLTNNTGNPNNAANVTVLNPRGIVFLNAPVAKSITNPRSGVIPNGATVTAPLRVGVWYDPWGSPYAVACDTTYDNKLGTANPYTDSDFSAGPSPLQLGAIAYSFGKNGALGGGAAVGPGFSPESGTAGKFKGSSDVLSWQ
jgi:prepilin-type N-terminal cleavage/methylation domain-containing protein